MNIKFAQIREEQGLSIRGLSKLSGVSKSHIQNIELGYVNPSIAVMLKLARALRVRLDELVDSDLRHIA